MDDADLELAVKAIVDSRVINTGQVCNCAGARVRAKRHLRPLCEPSG
ncbi:aldehyde dehydrogenase [Enterobacter cancerogenus]|uniref:Aldehyde dehydrogenase n=1 Tax=Enterobacter cancerogenus TaxID=69218 RepID=A0A484Z0R2_9ENTR|nr:aldehyde dehydrogenase [Enterobacter cancerogenus]